MNPNENLQKDWNIETKWRDIRQKFFPIKILIDFGELYLYKIEGNHSTPAYEISVYINLDHIFQQISLDSHHIVFV